MDLGERYSILPCKQNKFQLRLGGRRKIRTLILTNVAFQIVNCKDEKTFQNPKTYIVPRSAKGDYIRTELSWSYQPIDRDEDTMLMIPDSLDNYHPDAKVIGLYQYTYSWRKGSNRYSMNTLTDSHCSDHDSTITNDFTCSICSSDKKTSHKN